MINADARYDVQQRVVPVKIIPPNPNLFNATDESEANRHRKLECVDWIHDMVNSLLSNSWTRDPIITPKLLSMPLTTRFVRKAPKHTIHTKEDSILKRNFELKHFVRPNQLITYAIKKESNKIIE